MVAVTWSCYYTDKRHVLKSSSEYHSEISKEPVAVADNIASCPVVADAAKSNPLSANDIGPVLSAIA